MSQKLLLFIVLLLTTLCLACTSSFIDKEVIPNRIPLKVATVCMNAVPDKQINLQKFFSYMEEAAQQGVKLIVFPETALQQNPAWGLNHQPTQEELNYLHQSAETTPGESTQKLVKKAKELNIYVIFGMTEKVSDDDDLYNSCVLLGPNGIIGKHRKRYVWDSGLAGNEHLYWTSGNELGIINSPLGKIGIMICGNMFYNFPKSLGGTVTGPILTQKGADLLVAISAWPSTQPWVYDDGTRRNALESQRWHIVSNQVGSVGHTTNYGHSRIVDPDGNIVADTGPNEGIVIAETNLLIKIL
jgi:predicted amidohydrolase